MLQIHKKNFQAWSAVQIIKIPHAHCKYVKLPGHAHCQSVKVSELKPYALVHINDNTVLAFILCL